MDFDTSAFLNCEVSVGLDLWISVLAISGSCDFCIVGFLHFRISG